MPKRPSYPSIRRRQINIIEGIATKNVKLSNAANPFGVTPHELKHFITSDPRKLRKSYNRNPASTKLFESGQRQEVRTKLGVSRVRVYERKAGSTKYANSAYVERLTHSKYFPSKTADEKQEWAIWVREHDLPTSLHTIRKMWESGEITTTYYRAALRAWRDTYGVTDDEFYEWYGDTGGDDDDEGE